MKRFLTKKYLIFSFIFIAAVGGLFFLKHLIDKKVNSASDASSKVQLNGSEAKIVERHGVEFRETNWKELVQLNYHTGEKTPIVREISDKMVRIPGYIVPLTDEAMILDEFLFVPNDQACIHVPPPPPNLIIKAKLAKKLPYDEVFNPSWLMGKLVVVTTKSEYGSAAYEIKDAELEKYEEGN